MNRQILATTCLTIALFSSSPVFGGLIYQSGTLGEVDIPRLDVGTQVVLGARIAPSVFNSARFHLPHPVATTKVGGHFVGPYSSSDTFFGAIVQLADENDFPDSSDLTTPDVLGVTTMRFPLQSAEVLGDLPLELQPGWYAIVFGSGLFGTSGEGAAVRNGIDLNNPSFIRWHFGALGVNGWHEDDASPPKYRGNLRFVVEGHVVPEPSTLPLLLSAMLALGYLHIRRRDFSN